MESIKKRKGKGKDSKEKCYESDTDGSNILKHSCIPEKDRKLNIYLEDEKTAVYKKKVK